MATILRVSKAAVCALLALPLAACGGVLDPHGPVGADVLALAFGVMIVGIVIAGSLWIMYHLNANMIVPSQIMDMHLQH
jgi:hypothetical protein